MNEIIIKRLDIIEALPSVIFSDHFTNVLDDGDKKAEIVCLYLTA